MFLMAYRYSTGTQFLWYTRRLTEHPVPIRYHLGMSKQIAVRLPDEIVAFIDGLVSEGKANSRAVVVNRALERERRRAVAARDVAILTRVGDDPDMDSLAEHVVDAPLDLE